MRRRQITSLLLSSILALSAMATPFTQLPVYAAEAESDAVESEEAGADAGSDKSEADASDEGAGEADGGNQTEGNQSDETGESSGGNSENENSGATDGETVEDSSEDEGSGEVSGDNNTGDNTEAAEDEGTVEDSENEDGSVEDEEAAAGETKDEADGDFIFSGVVSVTTEGQDVVPEEKGGESPDDLFADYVEKSFNGELGKASSLKKRGAKSAGSNLSGIDRAIYNNISACLPQIAAGERASTVFEIFVDELGLEKTAWTAEELGIVSVLTLDEDGNIALDDNGYASISPEAVDAVSERTAFDLTKITGALLADNPYQLYWYEKTQSTTATGFGLTASYDNAIGDYLVGPVGNIAISFPVANEYSAGEYMVDTTIGQAVQTSVANANAIVSQYSSATDYDKLSGYKDEICDLVSYNEAAAGGGVSYGNPWQMIWVFDQDPTTNVVCEGYAKAFKYLCDQSNFSGDISCITVTGMMGGGTGEGPHMWNIVNMEDGKNYLVDVTNCDEGTIGAPDQLFLAGYLNKEEGYYSFEANGSEITYEYDESSLLINDDSALSIADSDYSPHEDDNTIESIVITDLPVKVSYQIGEELETEGGILSVRYKDGSSTNVLIDSSMVTGFDNEVVGEQELTVHYCGFTAVFRVTVTDESQILEEGECGDNLTWTFSDKGVLRISGKGRMIDYDWDNLPPWKELQYSYVIIDDGVTSIGDCAFLGGQNLITADIPESVEEIGISAFHDCSKLKEISIPEKVTEIQPKTFYSCDELQAVVIPNIVSIGNDAFVDCLKLTDLQLPDSLVSISSGAFLACKSITRINIPAGVNNIEENAFDQCSALTEICVDVDNPYFKSEDGVLYDFQKTSLIICPGGKEDIFTVPDFVNRIEASAFRNCTSLKIIVVPESVEYVGDRAFYQCYDLENITMPASVSYLGEGAFWGCHNLQKISIPEGITTIKKETFIDCYGLTEVSIPDNIETIEEGAFHGCYWLRSVYFTEHLHTIGVSAFGDCTGLVDVYFDGTEEQWNSLQIESDNDEIIRSHLFFSDGEREFQKIGWYIEDGTLFITGSGEMTDYMHFADYGSTAPWNHRRDEIKKIVVEDGITHIGSVAFGYCDHAEEIILPPSITSIGGGAFHTCTSITELRIPSGVRTLESAIVLCCYKLESIYIPKTVESIKSRNFQYCWELKNVYFQGTEQEWKTIEGSEYVHNNLQSSEDVNKYYENNRHTWGEYFIDKAATCTETGCRKRICSVCGEVEKEEIPATGHAWSEWTVVREATEDEEGLETRTCGNDASHTEERTIPKLAHVHNLTKTEAKEASCTEDGNVEFWTCSKCGKVYSDSEGGNEVSPEETVIHATGHAYDDWTVTKEATCTENGSREKTCANCGDKITEEIPATGHVWNEEYTIDKEASCTEDGSESIHCAVCGESDENSVQVIPATGHSYGEWTVVREATCTEAGSKEKVCASCGDKVTEEIPATGHAYGEWTVTKEATCTENGSREKVCAVCGFKVTEEILSIGHVWNSDYSVDTEATCIEEGSESIHCSVCGVSDENTVRVIPAKGHSYGEWTVVREATCTEAGSKEKVCASCGDKVTEEIPATGHAWLEWTVVREATEDEEGLETRTCSNDPSHTEERTIPKLAHVHNLIKTEAKEASCTEDGNIEFWTCSKCGRLYSDSEGVNEVDPEETVILAVGHKWNTEYTVDKEATCTEEGSESLHCSVCGVSDEDSVQVIPATGHSYGDWTVTKEATCTEAGSKEKVCASCGDKITEEISATGHSYGEWTVTKGATCTEVGSREKVCASCGDKITEEIPATGHAWSEWTVVREATEEEEGLERRTCSNDPSHTEERIIPKLTHVHELTKTEAKEASCTEDGNIEFWTCSKCGRVYSDSEGVNEIDPEETVIPAVGHKWNTEYTVDKEATCTEEGSESLHCSVCGVSDENTVRVIPATGHTYGDWTVTKEATCTEAGSKEKVCASCGDKVTEEIPATGHSYGEWTVTKEATCTEAGSREKVCANCGDKVTEEILAIGHLWDSEYTVDKEATCTEEGSESIHCSVCGVIDENSVQAIPKKEHTYGDWTVTKEATCTEAGSKEKVCASCGDKITEEIPATGHAWSEWTVVREATEEEEGLERRTCSNDPSHTEERTIPKLSHVHELTKTEAKEASCTEDGNIEFWTCSKCGRVYSDSEGVNEVDPEETVIHATGHKWNTEYTVDKEATCTEEGSESIHCSVCGVSDENSVQAIPKKEHTYGDWTVVKEATCTEAGSKEKVCANCGDKIIEEIPAKGHAYGDWTVTKEATCTEAGSKEKVCANCGDKITEEIPATGHQWNESYTIDVAPTYTEEGVESIHCSVCDEIQEGSERAVAKLRKPVSILEISGIVDKNYNGKAQTQAVVVMDGDTTLVNGTDYTISYENNINAGTASVIITGIGSYTGSVTKEFTIKKIANTITAKSFTRTYSTKAQSFDLGVKIKSGTPAYKSSSSSVTVSKAGKVTVKAKFMGKVTITITAPANTNYTVTTKKITITVNPTKTALVSVTSPSAGKMAVKWKKNAVGTGYQIQYSTSSKFTSPKTVTITKNSTLTRTIGSLAKGKKYYVRIRTYKTVGSTKFYSGWSAAKAVTVKK